MDTKTQVLLELAEAARKVWNFGLAFNACPTQSDIDELGMAVAKYAIAFKGGQNEEKVPASYGKPLC